MLVNIYIGAEYLPCHCCGSSVLVPNFPDTDEGNKDKEEFYRQVVEGDHPDMCDECKEVFMKIQTPKTNNDEPQVIRQFRGIVDNCSMGAVHDGNGRKVMVDHFSASAVIAVYDGINDKNKKLFVDKFGKSPAKMCDIAFKLLKK
jgi:hypothetical protein